MGFAWDDPSSEDADTPTTDNRTDPVYPAPTTLSSPAAAPPTLPPQPVAPHRPAPAAPPAAPAAPPAPATAGQPLMTILHDSLTARHPALEGCLAAAGCAYSVREDAALPAHSVHWVRGDGSSAAALHTLPRLVLVWTSTEVVRASGAGTLVPTLGRVRAQAEAWAPGCALSLVVCGRAVPGLELALSTAQLEVGMSARRLLNDRELSELLAKYTLVLQEASGGPSGAGAGGTAPAGRPSLGGSLGAAFLAGLTSHDVLHNKGVPRSLQQSWHGALCQLLPETAAVAVAQQYPSLRRLHNHLLRAGEGGLQDVRVGAKRLGPARSRRLYRVLLATKEEAAERCVG